MFVVCAYQFAFSMMIFATIVCGFEFRPSDFALVFVAFAFYVWSLVALELARWVLFLNCGVWFLQCAYCLFNVQFGF